MGSDVQERVVGKMSTTRLTMVTPPMEDVDSVKQVKVMVCLEESLWGI